MSTTVRAAAFQVLGDGPYGMAHEMEHAFRELIEREKEGRTLLHFNIVPHPMHRDWFYAVGLFGHHPDSVF